MARLAVILALVVVQATAVLADRSADVARLIALLKFDETLEIMREEGLRYGSEIADDLLPGADGDNWKATVARIYDAQKMTALVAGKFGEELRTTDLAPLLAYLGSEAGREVIALELSARRAFLDAGVEDAAKARFARMTRDNAPFLDQIDTLIADSDLIELNVMGTLNSSLMFYRGLTDGGAFEMTEADMLADVWAQEDATRADSRQWLTSFLLMAYQPLTPARLEAYAAFYRTPEGRDLNRAIFAGFDRMYEEVSYLLGLAVAEHMTSEPL